MHVRRARQFAERYGQDTVNPADYLPLSDNQEAFDDLLSRIK